MFQRKLQFYLCVCDREVAIDLPMEVDKLKEIASLGQFFSYVAGTTAAVLESEAFTSSSCGAPSSHRGIEIDNYRTTLPTKKGLSSSAAVCVLIARCFAAVFDVTLSLEQLMEIAYRGEMYTPSRCGRMDQCVVTSLIMRMNPRTILSIYYVCMYACMYSMYTCIYVYFRNLSIHQTTNSSHTQVGSMYACMNYIIVERFLRILKRILYCFCMYVWHVWHRRWVRVSGSCTLSTAHAACSLFLVRSGCTLSWRTCAPPRTR